MRHVGAALGCMLALAVGACAGEVRTIRRVAEAEVDPTFAEWPEVIEGIDDATALFAGLAPCVRQQSGRVECVYRRRAEGSLAAVEARGGCAILDGGRAIMCWGSHGNEGEPLFVNVQAGETAVEVAISSERAPLTCCYGCLNGEPHACARLASGRVTCWGWNFVGQLGDGRRTTSLGRSAGDPPPILDAPVLVEEISDATQIAVGMHHSCALRADRTVACWGYDLDGQLGDGGDASQPSPVQVIAVEDAVAISAGERHTCAVLADRRIACWGDERAFGVRPSRGATVPLPQLLEAPEPLVEVAAGGTYTCARAASGRVYCGGWY